MTGSSEAPIDLAMPGAQRSVQLWVNAPANDPGTPLRSIPAPQPQIVYAERKPRLTPPELRAKQGGVAPSAPPAGRPSLSAVAAPEVQSPRPARVADHHMSRWLIFLATALTVIAAAPLS